MTLRDINFGPVLNASGAQGFFGEGYPFHNRLKAIPGLGFGFDKTTLVTKTTTLHRNKGNMSLKSDWLTPKEFIPKCIYVSHLHGIALNAVSLSGPGAEFLLQDGRWQKQTRPILISFMSVGETAEEKLDQLKQFSVLLSEYRCSFQSPFGLELNFSCPNVKTNYDDLVSEIGKSLVIAGLVGVPLVVKINALVPPQDAVRIAEFDLCDAICVSNTIPFGELPKQIPWRKYFPDMVSPLTRRGFKQPGGLSGKPLLPIVKKWIWNARQAGLAKPIIGGGGILSPDDARSVLDTGATAISLGSIAFLRPHRMAKTIQAAYGWFDWDTE